ncbi:MAG: ABC transporter ATP-binding protein/permease [Holophagaceae bacterium]|nr:ABC transporter ATP-binding protein/permease [Holophagaceae bacterium]
MQTLSRFFREHLRPNLGLILAGSGLAILAGLLQTLLVGSLKWVFEGFAPTNIPAGISIPDALPAFTAAKAWLTSHLPEGSALRTSAFVPTLVIVIFALKGLCSFSATMLMVRSGIKATQRLRERLFGHLLRQEPAFFQKYPVGELLTRCISDVGAVQGIASNQFAESIREAATAIAGIAFVLYLDWQRSLVLFLAAPLIIFPLKGLSHRIRKINHRNQEAIARLLQRLKEVFSNVRVVKAFAREDYEAKRLEGQNIELFRIGMKSARAIAMSHPIMEMAGGFMLAGLILWVSADIQAGKLATSDFMTYLVAVFAMYDPLRRLTRINNEVQVARASLDRIFAMLDRKPQMLSPAKPVKVPAKPQKLSFENVHFAYEKGHEVLDGINIEVNSGETVALVGGSGGGKTTLVNLVPRFYDPNEGRVLIDGMDIREFDPGELRQQIGIVTQETLLFMDSVHDNIAYGKPFSREDVAEAAKKAYAHDFILKLPNGYDTHLAETGSSLSGGQRQRIAIARALLHDPPILVLDEATSALDTESERAVQDALEALMKNRTALVIAHRLSTIQKATRIYVLRQGQVTEVGRHEDLLALKGEYARLHQLQFRE